MRGGIIIATAALLGTCGLGSMQPAFAGYASMVVDSATGEVLNEVNADQLNHPASLTKMMTLYLAFEALHRGELQMDQRLPISRFAQDKTPTKLGLIAGHTISVHDCIFGMITLSANDAAAVMAEALGHGSETAFAETMTAKAHELGMTSTTYHNASGLPDDEQVTTARDLIKLSMALYQNFPQEYGYFKTRSFVFQGRTIKGHNHILDEFQGADGIKTGFTSASGFNLAASAVRDDHRLFAVVMGGQSASARDHLMVTLLDDGFAHRPTDPILVARAAGQDTRTARRLLADAENVVAAINPISKAEAAPIRASNQNGHGHVLQASAGSNRWMVQVGAFGQATSAERAASEAIRLTGLHGDRMQIASPTKHEKVYRARLTGFNSEREARNACTTLHRKGRLCVIIAPTKGGVRLASD